MPQRMAVSVPVTDLRKKPVPRRNLTGQDLNQESQLLLGEDVRVLRRRGPWSYVECLNQLVHEGKKGWGPYRGWVRSRDLAASDSAPRWNAMVKRTTARVRLDPANGSKSMTLTLGTGLHVIEPSGPDTLRVSLAAGMKGDIRRKDVRFIGIHRGDKEMRERILKSAKQFLGEPYVWGGKSSAKLGKGCGVDCSGLVSLSYNAAGAYNFPRNARDQYARARRIAREQLKPADLVFISAQGEPQRIVHVMMYSGGGRVVEAASKANGVRTISLAQRFGIPLSKLENGTEIDGKTIYFGTLL